MKKKERLILLIAKCVHQAMDVQAGTKGQVTETGVEPDFSAKSIRPRKLLRSMNMATDLVHEVRSFV